MRLNLVGALIGIVISANFQAATVFLVFAARYTPSFELHGVVGKAIKFAPLLNIHL